MNGTSPPRLGDYALEWRLGSGAFSTVWKGRHDATGAVAAIKVARTDASPRAIELIEREARALWHLTHPHIVSVFDQGAAYLVMSYIEGRSLADALDDCLSPAEAVRITLQLGSALAHAHEHGVVHRDVKPANVLLDGQRTAYLVDFGMALVPDDLPEQIPWGGTPDYMAPEQLAGAQVTPAADQFSLARTLLEMLGGDLTATAIDPLAGLSGALRERMAPVLLRALAPAAAARWPSVRDFVQSLETVHLTDLVVQDSLAPSLRSPRPFHWSEQATATDKLTPQISRVDYSLRATIGAGALAPATAEALAVDTGLGELAWSLYGRTDRLGPLASRHAIARARQLVVLLPGMYCPRTTWTPLAEALCRDNALTVVLTLDWFGYGESELQLPVPGGERPAPRQVMFALLRFLSELGVRELPTVIAAHSLGTVPLMSLSDAELGDHVSRLAIAPVLPFSNPSWDWIVRALSVVTSLDRWRPGTTAALFSREGERSTADLDEAARSAIVQAMRRYPASVAVGTMAASLRDSLPPERGAGLARCTVLAGMNDPYLTRDACDRALRSIGFNLANRHWCIAATHYPHLPSPSHPERFARNQDQLVRLLNAMLLDANEAAVSRHSRAGGGRAGELDSTLVGDLVG